MKTLSESILTELDRGDYKEPMNESIVDSNSYYQKIMDKIYNAKNNLKEEEFKSLLKKVINECKNLK